MRRSATSVWPAPVCSSAIIPTRAVTPTATRTGSTGPPRPRRSTPPGTFSRTPASVRNTTCIVPPGRGEGTSPPPPRPDLTRRLVPIGGGRPERHLATPPRHRRHRLGGRRSGIRPWRPRRLPSSSSERSTARPASTTAASLRRSMPLMPSALRPTPGALRRFCRSLTVAPGRRRARVARRPARFGRRPGIFGRSNSPWPRPASMSSVASVVFPSPPGRPLVEPAPRWRARCPGCSPKSFGIPSARPPAGSRKSVPRPRFGPPTWNGAPRPAA